jgi:hypothetical protein
MGMCGLVDVEVVEGKRGRDDKGDALTGFMIAD